MREVNFLLKTFFLGVMMMAFSFEGHSQSMATHKASKKRRGGTEPCYPCQIFVRTKIYLRFMPTHFPFKLENLHITYIGDQNTITTPPGDLGSATLSITHIINPSSGNLELNQTIYPNSPLLDSQGYINFSSDAFSNTCMNTSRHSSEVGEISAAKKSILVNPFINSYFYSLQIESNNYDSNSGGLLGTEITDLYLSLDEKYSCTLTNPLFSTPNFLREHQSKLDKDLISVFPNPFHNYLNTNITLMEEERLNISVYDVIGKKTEGINISKILPAGENLLKLNLEGYPAGVYFLRITGNQTNKIIKIVKKSS